MKARAYYNEIDPHAAAWLRELIKGGYIAEGDVDERSIVDVRPGDIAGYTQCHFFAGIGVWSYALRQAGWPDDRPVWTGSCPCQPFSTAGKGAGFADERHLWPHFHYLISQLRPSVVFGEQVASKDGLAWLDLVQADLEGTGYACGAVDTCAAGFGAPHIRQRLYWVAERVADAERNGSQGRLRGWPDSQRQAVNGPLGRVCADSGLADAESERWNGRENSSWEARRDCFEDSCDDGRLADAEGSGRGEKQSNGGGGATGSEKGETFVRAGCSGVSAPLPTNGYWRNADWLYCRDGKWRPVEPGTFPLVNGASARVGRLRGYGNAIVATQAQAFIEAYCQRL